MLVGNQIKQLMNKFCASCLTEGNNFSKGQHMPPYWDLKTSANYAELQIN